MILWHFTRCGEAFVTLAPVSYLRSLVVRAVHRHRTGVGSIPAGGRIVDDFFSTVLGWNFDMCIHETVTKSIRDDIVSVIVLYL